MTDDTKRFIEAELLNALGLIDEVWVSRVGGSNPGLVRNILVGVLGEVRKIEAPKHEEYFTPEGTTITEPEGTTVTECLCPCGKSRHNWYMAEAFGCISYGVSAKEAIAKLCLAVRRMYVRKTTDESVLRDY